MTAPDSKPCVRCDVEIPLDRTTNLCSKCYEDELEDWEYGHADHPDYEDRDRVCDMCEGGGEVYFEDPSCDDLTMGECTECRGTGEI